jgi:hypothetical protein
MHRLAANRRVLPLLFAAIAFALTGVIPPPPIFATELEPPRSGDQRATASPPGSAAELDAAVPPADKSAHGALAPRKVLAPAPNKSVTRPWRRARLANSGASADAMVGVGFGF